MISSRFLGVSMAAAALGLLAACSGTPQESAVETTESPYAAHEVSPGEIDDYYVLSSGGHSGDVRVMGLPSINVQRFFSKENFQVLLFSTASSFFASSDAFWPFIRMKAPKIMYRASSGWT